MSIRSFVKINVRKPNSPSNKKGRLAEDKEKKVGAGANTNRYVAFLLSSMNELDKLKSMKGACLVKKNAFIHGNEALTQIITEACLQFTKRDLAGFTGHSAGRIDD
ncbi:hypothetical protein BY458DRAFT_489099 [Sporodiniella umbellata]|nr:hypothetical protein BY458DRAFT_489099 [Sporodiniella umbellata]